MSMQFGEYGPTTVQREENSPVIGEDTVISSNLRLQYLIDNTSAIIYSSVPTNIVSGAGADSTCGCMTHSA